MTVDPTPSAPKKHAAKPQLSPKQQRIEREKAALKANMARRKAQARAKTALDETTDHTTNGAEEGPSLNIENE